MNRALLILSMLCLVGWGPIGLGQSGTSTVVSSGVAWVDSFNRSNGTDLQANCSSEGPNGDCGWIEVSTAGDPVIAASKLQDSAAFLIASDTDTTTLAQYAGVQFNRSTSSNRQVGGSIRGNALGGASDCHYLFSFSASNYRLTSCDTGTTCVNIHIFTNGGGDFPNFASGDGVGISSDAETGDDIQFTVYHFTTSPPAAFADWGAASTNYTVCDSGGSCDKTWDTAPSSANCTADNKRVGMASIGGGTPKSDNWRGGDI